MKTAVPLKNDFVLMNYYFLTICVKTFYFYLKLNKQAKK